MGRNRCVWKAVLALFVAATFSLLTIGCSEDGGKQSKSDPAKKGGGSSSKSDHPK